MGCFKSPKQQVLSLKERTAGDRLVRKFVLWPGSMCRLWTEPRILQTTKIKERRPFSIMKLWYVLCFENKGQASGDEEAERKV